MADVAISRYYDAIYCADMSKVCTKIYLCLQHFRQPTSYLEIATSPSVALRVLAMTW